MVVREEGKRAWAEGEVKERGRERERALYSNCIILFSLSLSSNSLQINVAYDFGLMEIKWNIKIAYRGSFLSSQQCSLNLH